MTHLPRGEANNKFKLFSVFLSHNWHLYQLDVNNAFLHGSLNEKVFMHQPSGFIDATNLSYVCRLRKALYGLKQVPHAWYQELSRFLVTHGFENQCFIIGSNNTFIS